MTLAARCRSLAPAADINRYAEPPVTGYPSISADRAQAAANRLHVAAAYWSMGQTDGRMYGRPTVTHRRLSHTMRLAAVT